MELKRAKMLFNDKCDIYECVQEVSGAVTKTEYRIKYQSVPCRISFIKSGSNNESDTQSTQNRGIRLFLDNEPHIKSGDIITVVHMDRTEKFKAASEGKHYATHQETELDVFENNP